MQGPPAIPPHLGLESARSQAQGHYHLRSTLARAVGDSICAFSGVPRTAQSRYTLQFGIDDHRSPAPDFLILLSHACDPNVFFDLERGHLVVIRPIAPGDEISIFYPATEWVMEEPFTCWCGAVGCLGTITGARDLPKDVLARHRVAPHIRALAAFSVNDSHD